jgi:ABC-type bacteriocin/lantibiotic exporter with double-glycine peptidase domain
MQDYSNDEKDIVENDIDIYTSNVKFLRKCIITACCCIFVAVGGGYLTYFSHVTPLYGMYIWMLCVISVCHVYFYIQFRQNLEKLMVAKEVRISFIINTLAGEDE